jgi:protease IV
MRNFFKIFFACLMALTFAFFFFFIVFVGGIASSGKKPITKVDANSVLNLTLNGEITDRSYNNPFRNLSPMSALTGNISDQSTIGLFDLKEVLIAAKNDDHIKGIFLKIEDIQTGPSTMFDLRESLEDFKESGKFIYAYSNSAGEMSLLLNTAATKFYINPVGDCEFDGFAMQMQYMKGLYDKLGVDFKVFYVGEYKSATEGFRRTDMSAEDRVQRSALLEDINRSYLAAIQKKSKLSADSLKWLQDNLAVMDAADAVKYHFADGLKYEEEVKEEIKTKLGYKKDAALKMISYSKYLELVKSKRKAKSDNNIAVVYAEGEINDGKEDEGVVGRDAYIKILHQLQEDKSVKGVIIRVNSPGGSAFASEQIYHELVKLKAKKPIVISMGDYAASGGYYISAPSDKIIAQPNTITGSIGIFGLVPDIRNALTSKLGITFDEVKTAEHANFFNLTNDWDELEMSKVQRQVEKGYDIFLDRVSKGRKMDTAAVNKIARGRVWTGQDAKAIGLVDELGGLELAIKSVKELAKIKDANIVSYPKEKTLIESITSGLFGDENESQAKLLKNLTPQMLYFKELEKIQSRDVLQYRLPFDVTIK